GERPLWAAGGGPPRASSESLRGTPCAAEPAVLRGRRGVTDEFLGRGSLLPQSPRSSGRGGRPLDKCLVQRHADTVIRKSHAAVGVAVNHRPVSLLRKKEISSRFRGAPVDKRGHIRVRRVPAQRAATAPPTTRRGWRSADPRTARLGPEPRATPRPCRRAGTAPARSPGWAG